MNANQEPLEECITLLLKQRMTMKEKHATALAETIQISQSMKKLDRVIASLRLASGSSSASAAKESPKKRQCSTKGEVLETMTAILEENSEVPIDDLKALVGDRLREKGRNLSLFGKFFSECLRTGGFAETAPGVVALAKHIATLTF